MRASDVTMVHDDPLNFVHGEGAALTKSKPARLGESSYALHPCARSPLRTWK
jgi:hypothetical protein